MNFKKKILLLCFTVYLLALIPVFIITINLSYQKNLRMAVDSALAEEQNIYKTSVIYMLSKSPTTNNSSIAVQGDSASQNSFDIKDYVAPIVDMYKIDLTFLEFFSSDEKPVTTEKFTKDFLPARLEIKEALASGKVYILRTINDLHYIFITRLIDIEGQKLVQSFIKDITHVDNQRQTLIGFFAIAAVLGTVIVAVASFFLTKVLLRRVEILSEAANKISSGCFEHRVQISGRDEISFLAARFNTMAYEVEKRIIELKDENYKKQRFIDNLTHEIRTPLTAIIGYSELLATTRQTEESYYRSLSFINSEGKRLLNLTTNLMNFILLKQSGLNLASCSITELISEVCGIISVNAAEKGVQLKNTTDANYSNEQLVIDRELIKLTILNIMDNAFNACAKGCYVEISFYKTSRHSVVSIRDNGKGISTDDLQKITEPFYRVDKSRSRKLGGLGLGLSLCDEIIKSHKGSLIIKSQLQQGTTVLIEFQT
jgi:signal transduction histidine kinase